MNELLIFSSSGGFSVSENWYFFVLPFLFNILDFLTGFIAAAENKEISSSKMREGLFHKLSFLFALVLAALLQYSSSFLDLGFDIPTLGTVSAFIILTECVSIVENLIKLNPELSSNKLFGSISSLINHNQK